MRFRIPSVALEGLLYALTAFGPFAFGCVEPWSRAGLEILAFLLALAVFLKGRPAGSRAGALFWLFPAAVSAFGCVQLATPVSPGDPFPLRPFSAVPHETRASVLLWLSYAAVLYSVPRIVVSVQSARRYARFLVCVGLVLAVFGLLQLAAGEGTLVWLRPGPRFASYYNRDHAANVLLMSLGVGIGLLISWSRAKPEIEGGSRQGRASARGLLAAGLAALFFGIVACSSQGALLAIPLAAACCAFAAAGFASSARERRRRAAAAVAGAALIVFFAYFHVSAAADAGGLVDDHVMGRLSIYADAWRWWRDAPLFGTGLGGFEALYPAYQDLTLLSVVSHAHSDWIEFGLETGSFGLAFALLAAGLAAVVGARSWLSARSGEMRALIGGLFAAAAAFAAHSLVEFSFQIPGNAALFFATIGFLLSAPSWASKSAVRLPEDAPSSGAALLAAAYCVVLLRTAAVPAVAARRANLGGDPMTRIVQAAEALSLDADPAFGSILAEASYRAAGEDPAADYSLLRISLRHALAAAVSRPFSSDSLFLAGKTLWRLGRPEDARVYLDRAGTVRFAAFEARRITREERRERDLAILRELHLAPEKAAAP